MDNSLLKSTNLSYFASIFNSIPKVNVFGLEVFWIKVCLTVMFAHIIHSWWWTERPGVLQSMGLQRVRHDWATELNWTQLQCQFAVWLCWIFSVSWALVCSSIKWKDQMKWSASGVFSISILEYRTGSAGDKRMKQTLFLPSWGILSVRGGPILSWFQCSGKVEKVGFVLRLNWARFGWATEVRDRCGESSKHSRVMEPQESSRIKLGVRVLYKFDASKSLSQTSSIKISKSKFGIQIQNLSCKQRYIDLC